MTLDYYLAKQYLITFTRVFLGITLLVYLVDFLTNLNRLNELDSQILNASILSLLRTTTYLSISMPLIIMLSSLAFSINFTRSNEFIISRASGLSVLRSFVPVMLSAFLLGLISIFIFDPIAGKMNNQYDFKLAKLQSKKETKNKINDNEFWIRQLTSNGHQIIKAINTSNTNQELYQISIFVYDKNGMIIERIFSENASLYDNYFLLETATKWLESKLSKSQSAHGQTIKDLRISTEISSADLLDGHKPPGTISPWNMNKQIQKIKLSGLSTLRYESKKLEQYARPFLFITMIIIGSVFTIKKSRSRNIGFSAILAVLLGFFLHFFQNICITLGRSGELPLIIATWSPFLSIGLLTLALFLHYEDG